MGVVSHYCREYGGIDVTTLSNVTVRRSMTCRGTHHVMKSTRPSPSENHLRIINTYGACASGGGKRPGYEATAGGSTDEEIATPESGPALLGLHQGVTYPHHYRAYEPQ